MRKKEVEVEVERRKGNKKKETPSRHAASSSMTLSTMAGSPKRLRIESRTTSGSPPRAERRGFDGWEGGKR